MSTPPLHIDTFIDIDRLPDRIDPDALLEHVYRGTIDEVVSALLARQSCLVKADREVAPPLLVAIRDRLRGTRGAPKLLIADHRKDSGEGPIAASRRAVAAAVAQIRERVREEDVSDAILAIPNLDALVGGDQSGNHLDVTTRELLLLTGECPAPVLAFADPTVSLPPAVSAHFDRNDLSATGMPPGMLRYAITRSEARKLDVARPDLGRLYRFVSGANPRQLRRLLAPLDSEDFLDGTPDAVIAWVRKATLRGSTAQIPDVRMTDVAGYAEVKTLLENRLLKLVERAERGEETSPEQRARILRAIPRNILFTGPPGCGKNLLISAIANTLGCPVFDASPIKSMYVGRAEEGLRTVHAKARRVAPAVIYMDECDGWAGARAASARAGDPAARWHRSKSDESLLNTALALMQDLYDGEAVYVLAATNHASALDDAFRSRMHLEVQVGYPDADDRREVVRHHAARHDLELAPPVVERLVADTETFIDPDKFTKFSPRALERVVGALANEQIQRCAERGCAEVDAPVTVEDAARAVRERIVKVVPRLSFASVAGYDAVKAELGDIVGLLRLATDPTPSDRRARARRMLPNGILFHGPPGTGKTLLALSMAGEAGLTTRTVSAGDFKDGLYGESERKVDEMFEELGVHSPSMLVVDELDAIAEQRPGRGGGVGIQNALLTGMDGLNKDQVIIVVGTTNRLDAVDPAFKRPGRFDVPIEIPPPDAADRAAIVRHFANEHDLEFDDALIGRLVRRTEGGLSPDRGAVWSGDHLRHVVESMARRCLLSPGVAVDDRLLDEVLAPMTTRPIALNERERRVVAVHEAGHAVASHHVEGALPVTHVSVASEYDGVAGHARAVGGSAVMRTERELFAEIACLLAGQVAEELVIGDRSTGARNDIERATRLAYAYVAQLGFDAELGAMAVKHPQLGGGFSGVSGATLARVEQRVAILLERAKKVARACLTAHRRELTRLADRLVAEREVQL